jgi:class 3 adenylate cyclase
MNRLERIIGFIHWPVSRKMVLLGVLGVSATGIATLVNLLAHSSARDSLLDLPLLNRYMVVWMLAQVLATLASVPAAIAGREARWGTYLFIAVQAPFMAGLLHLFGTMGSPLVAIFPALVILWTLYFDERFGLFGLAVMLGCILAIGILEAQGILPYAPAVMDRSLDTQSGGVWFGTVLFHILVLLGFCMSLCVLLLLSRRLQDTRLHAVHQTLGEANRLIRRYVPTQLADQILAGDYAADSKPRRRRLTIVFADVEGYTAACEALDAEVLETVVNRYLTEMVAIADHWGGTLNQIVGDGIMVFFGAPQVTNDQDHALRAVRMALDMQSRVQEMSDLWVQHGFARPFRIRIGINTGEASVGDFGSAGRKLYSGIGLNTNLAERIQSHCEPGSVLINRSTWVLVNRDIRCEYRGELLVKGASTPLSVYTACDGAATTAATGTVLPHPDATAATSP